MNNPPTPKKKKQYKVEAIMVFGRDKKICTLDLNFPNADPYAIYPLGTTDYWNRDLLKKEKAKIIPVTITYKL